MMYKSAGKFQQRAVRKRRPGSISHRALRRFGNPQLSLNRIDAEVVAATPSLRKRTDLAATKSIYFVRFTLMSDPHVTFVKIGITATSIEERFFLDRERYHVQIICRSAPMLERIARSREASLHREFERYAFLPPKRLLSGGNTECYLLYGKPYDRVVEIVSSWGP